MPRWSARKGQTEPLAALAAVLVIAVAFALYVGVFEASYPDSSERNVAQDAADRVERSLSTGGVLRPSRLASGNPSGPDGYRLNVTLHVDGDETTIGPRAPETADSADRRVSVKDPLGEIRDGRLEVRVWN